MLAGIRPATASVLAPGPETGIAPGAEPAVPPGPKPGRLRKRREFLAVAGTRRKWTTPGLMLQLRRIPEGTDVRVGFTVSRKVGNAVVRNRAKRRLRALAAEMLPTRVGPGHELVLIGRTETPTRPWPALKADLAAALAGLKIRPPAP